MRKKGSKDKKKRKVKNILCGKIERELIEQYNGGICIKYLCEKYNVSKSAISTLFKKRKVPKRIDYGKIKFWEKVDDPAGLQKDICGVYAIYFKPTCGEYNDIKLYIGSSVDIRKRLLEHINQLNNNKHNSQNLMEYFNNKKYSIHYAIIKRCCDKDIMQEERGCLGCFNKSCLLNTWRSIDENEILPWLQKAIKLKAYNSYKINDNGCWEIKNVHKSGYGRVRVVAFKDWGHGEKRYFFTHRLAYWEKYGKYPELIRHKCNNPKCRNPDHLEEGNYRDNAIDKRGDFPIEFEEKWLEFGGDLSKLTQHFANRWSGNQEWNGYSVSYSIYEWEKKLGLREKYPEILDANESRRFCSNK